MPTPEEKAKAAAIERKKLEEKLRLKRQEQALTAESDEQIKVRAEKILEIEAAVAGKKLEQVEAETDLAVLKSRSLEGTENQLQALEELNAKRAQQVDIIRELAELDGLALENANEMKEALLKNVALTEDQIAQTKRNIEGNEKFINSYKTGMMDVTNVLSEQGKLLNLSTAQAFSLFSAVRGGANLITEQIEDLMAAGGAVVVWMNLANQFKKVFDAGVVLTKELDEQRASFMKATGASQEFTHAINDAYEETRLYGVGAAEAYAASSALFESFSDFTRLGESARGEMIKTVSILELHGVAGADAAKGMQLATKALNMTGKQARQQQLRLAAFAKDLGVAPGKMAQDFAAAGGEMAKLGQSAERAFKDVAKTAKATGMEVSRLLDITKQFDTFETAADQVGKLNAMLGGDFINALELMEAENPAERMKMLTDAVNDAGVSFDDMTYYEKLALTEAMGLADVSELANALSGDMDTMNGEIKHSAASMDAMADRARANLSVQQQLQTLLVALTPTFVQLAEAIGGAANHLAEIVEQNPGLIKIIGALSIGVTVITAFASVIGIATGVVAAFGVVFGAASAPLWVTVAAVVALIGVISALVYWMFENEVSSNFLEGIGKFGDAFSFMKDNILLLLGPVGWLIKGLQKMGFFMFEKPYASNFLEGIVKLANAFGSIAVNVLETLNPLAQMAKIVDGIGLAIGSVAEIFRILTSPEAAENIMKVGKAISDIPIAKSVAFTHSMKATSVAALASAGAAGGGGVGDIKQGDINVTVLLDGKDITKKVVKEVKREMNPYTP